MTPYLPLLALSTIVWGVSCAAEGELRCALCSGPLDATKRIEPETGKKDSETDTDNRIRCLQPGGVPAPGGTRKTEGFLYRRCSGEGPKSGLCRRFIVDTHYHEISGLEELYCRECFKNYVPCVFCARPVPGHPHEESTSGAGACRVCTRDPVSDPHEMNRIFLEIRHRLEEMLGLRIHRPIQIRTVNQFKEDSGEPRVRFHRALARFEKRGGDSTITVVSGLPRPLLYETLAHELAHAWQSQNPVPNQRLIVKEGFAQWVAAKILRDRGFPQAARRIGMRKDLYGEGYRFMVSIEKKEGFRGVLSYVTENR